MIHGTATGSTCSGSTVTVDSSHDAAITVPAKDAVAFDLDSVVSAGTTTTPPLATVPVTFHEYAITTWGQNVSVVGDIAALGGWNTANAIPLSSVDTRPGRAP